MPRCASTTTPYWFSDAPVLAVLAPRYARSLWKYRRHAKAYRALVLDSGHLSQTLYPSATELGLGAFVTSAINEIDIERGFGLDPLAEGPLAVCGFGWRAREMTTSEFDPGGEVWLRRPDGADES
ncbi:nitroreductase family protein [Streptomyces sp. NPDC093111]|uniref:nitroreductase family protein n=1 Tax=Streptomyces sp. NPDC093111 TaxID=3154978 RepID=UPI00343B6ED1